MLVPATFDLVLVTRTVERGCQLGESRPCWPVVAANPTQVAGRHVTGIRSDWQVVGEGGVVADAFAHRIPNDVVHPRPVDDDMAMPVALQ